MPFLAAITLSINTYRKHLCHVYLSAQYGCVSTWEMLRTSVGGFLLHQVCTGVCLNQNVFCFNQSSAELPARPNKDKWAKVRGGGGGGALQGDGCGLGTECVVFQRTCHTHTQSLTHKYTPWYTLINTPVSPFKLNTQPYALPLFSFLFWPPPPPPIWRKYPSFALLFILIFSLAPNLHVSHILCNLGDSIQLIYSCSFYENDCRWCS